MTTPISVGSGSISANVATHARDRAGTSGASDFASILDALVPGKVSGRASTAIALGAKDPLTESAEPEALFGALEALFGQLNDIRNTIKSDLLPNPDAMATLADLLKSIESLLDASGDLASDPALLAQLNDLAQAMGLEPGTSAFETLAALAARTAGDLRETAPELAAALNALASRLDTHAVAMDAALANGEPEAAIKLKLIESETKPNASAAIGRNDAKVASPETTPDIKLAGTGEESLRSLTGASGDNAGTQPASVAAQAKPTRPEMQLAAAAITDTALAAQTGDAPDTLALPGGPSQAANTTPGVGRAEAAAYARAEPRINMPYIAVEIARSIQNGISRFEIRLNPPELGRVDVRIEMDNSGNVTARLAVEKSETLDLLQRDQRALERALADAGIDGSKTDLEFSLRQDHEGRENAPDAKTWTASIAADAQSDEPLAPVPGTMRGYARLDAVNLWV